MESQQDADSRLAGDPTGNYSADYLYLANPAPEEQIIFKANGAVRMNTVQPSDPVSRLTAIQSAVAGANQLPQAFAYQKEFYHPSAVASSAPGGAFFGAPKGQPYYSQGQ